MRYVSISVADIAQGKLSWCSDCGLVVWDKVLHDKFHPLPGSIIYATGRNP